MGSKKSTTVVSPPPMSPEEQQLQREQLQILQEWRSETAALRPLLLEQAGLFETVGPGGEMIIQKTPQRLEQEQILTEFQNTAADLYRQQNELVQQELAARTTPEAEAARKQQAEIEAQFRDVAQQYLTRQQKALAGELPVSEALKRQKQTAFEQFKEAQGRIGQEIIGDTPETAAAKGTGAQAALQRFQESYNILEEQERQGIIGLEGQLAQQSALQSAAFTQQLGTQPGLPGIPGILGLQPGISGVIPSPNQAGLFSAYGQAQVPYEGYRNQLLQASIANASQDTSSGISPFGGALSGAAIGSMFGVGGALIGGATGLAGGFASQGNYGGALATLAPLAAFPYLKSAFSSTPSGYNPNITPAQLPG